VRLWDYHQGVREAGAANEVWGRFRAAVVDDDDFETQSVRLLRQGLQTSFEHRPVVINGDDNAEHWRPIRILLVLDHASSAIFDLLLFPETCGM
jgi:hypothetical protein